MVVQTVPKSFGDSSDSVVESNMTRTLVGSFRDSYWYSESAFDPESIVCVCRCKQKESLSFSHKKVAISNKQSHALPNRA